MISAFLLSRNLEIVAEASCGAARHGHNTGSDKLGGTWRELLSEESSPVSCDSDRGLFKVMSAICYHINGRERESRKAGRLEFLGSIAIIAINSIEHH